MHPVKILLICFFWAASVAPAQQSGKPEEPPPSVFLENNRAKNEKEGNTRTIDGTVKDSSDNPLGDAIVQLKDLKTSNIVNFATKDDGKYVFRDLPLNINYELLAKRGNVATPVKKVSVYDTRKHIIVNFQLAAAKP